MLITMIIRFDISLEEFNFIDALISIITILLATHSNITEHQAELDKSCNLAVLPVMNEILFRKNGTKHFFLVSACCKLFSFPCSLSLLHRYQDGTGPEQSATSRGNIPEVKVIMECELLIMLM